MNCIFCNQPLVLVKETSGLCCPRHYGSCPYYHQNSNNKFFEISIDITRGKNDDYAFYFYPWAKVPVLTVIHWRLDRVNDLTPMYNGPIPPNLTPETVNEFLDRLISMKAFL